LEASLRSSWSCFLCPLNKDRDTSGKDFAGSGSTYDLLCQHGCRRSFAVRCTRDSPAFPCGAYGVPRVGFLPAGVTCRCFWITHLLRTGRACQHGIAHICCSPSNGDASVRDRSHSRHHLLVALLRSPRSAPGHDLLHWCPQMGPYTVILYVPSVRGEANHPLASCCLECEAVLVMFCACGQSAGTGLTSGSRRVHPASMMEWSSHLALTTRLSTHRCLPRRCWMHKHLKLACG
jgi:hypothetical protein